MRFDKLSSLLLGSCLTLPICLSLSEQHLSESFALLFLGDQSLSILSPLLVDFLEHAFAFDQPLYVLSLYRVLMPLQSVVQDVFGH